MEQEYIILQIQEDDWLYEQGIDEGDLVVLTENHLYKKMEER